MNDTFCSRPFNELYLGNGSFSPCCIIKENPYESVEEYLNSDWLKSLKTNLTKGIKDSRCSICWDAESVGAWSNRVTHKVDTSKSLIEEAHITFSNTCNLACQMCDASLSTSWGVRNWRSGKSKQVIRWNTFDNKKTKLYFYKHILPSLRWLGVSGGEPFQCADHFEFLKVAPLINPNLELFYNSNMTNLFYKGHYIPNYFDKFKSVNISASVDGWGQANDYQRLNSDLHGTVLKNILKIKEYVTYIHATVSIYTIYSLEELIQWCVDREVDIKIHFVSQDFLNPNILPKALKEEIASSLFNRFKNNDKMLLKIKNELLHTLFSQPNNNNQLERQFKRVTEENNLSSRYQFPNYEPRLANWYDSILL